MTTEEAIRLIMRPMPEADSPQKRQDATSALNAALSAINRLGVFEWNRTRLTCTLKATKNTYKGSELFKGLTVRKIDSRIWYTDDNAQYIVVKTADEFSSLAKQMITSGRPQFATMYGTNQTFQVAPTPDTDYSIDPIVSFMVTQIEQLPVDLEDLAVERALMQVLDEKTRRYLMAERNWKEGSEAAKQTGASGYRRWKGGRMQGDPYGIGRTGTRARRKRNDSRNLI